MPQEFTTLVFKPYRGAVAFGPQSSLGVSMISIFSRLMAYRNFVLRPRFSLFRCPLGTWAAFPASPASSFAFSALSEIFRHGPPDDFR